MPGRNGQWLHFTCHMHLLVANTCIPAYVYVTFMWRVVDYFAHFSCYVKSQFPSELKNVIGISVDSFDCKFYECSLRLIHSAHGRALKTIQSPAFEMRVKYDLYISNDRNGMNNGFAVSKTMYVFNMAHLPYATPECRQHFFKLTSSFRCSGGAAHV